MRCLISYFLLSAMLCGQAEAADVRRGRELSIKRCSQCHVVGDYNRMGGIGSTPSFQWLTQLRDYETRLRTFYSRPPHPVFARVRGYPRWSTAPSPLPEFSITAKEIEDILAFVRTLASMVKAPVRELQ